MRSSLFVFFFSFLEKQALCFVPDSLLWQQLIYKFLLFWFWLHVQHFSSLPSLYNEPLQKGMDFLTAEKQTTKKPNKFLAWIC